MAFFGWGNSKKEEVKRHDLYENPKEREEEKIIKRNNWIRKENLYFLRNVSNRRESIR